MGLDCLKRFYETVVVMMETDFKVRAENQKDA